MSTETKDIVLEFGDVSKVAAVQFANQDGWCDLVAPYTEIPYRHKSITFKKDFKGRTIDQFDQKYTYPAVTDLCNKVLEDYKTFDRGRNEFLIKFVKPYYGASRCVNNWMFLESRNTAILVTELKEYDVILNEYVHFIKIEAFYRFIKRSNHVLRS